MGKYILIICVFCTCSIIGYLLGEIYRKRPLELKECYKGIILLENQVVYNNTPLPQALREISDKMKDVYQNILKEAAVELEEGYKGSVFEIFKELYLKNKNDLYIRDEDKKILSDLFSSLGDTGVYGQEKVFKVALENLKININEADEVAKKNTKMYRYLGICFGAMISIILI